MGRILNMQIPVLLIYESNQLTKTQLEELRTVLEHDKRNFYYSFFSDTYEIDLFRKENDLSEVHIVCIDSLGSDYLLNGDTRGLRSITRVKLISPKDMLDTIEPIKYNRCITDDNHTVPVCFLNERNKSAINWLEWLKLCESDNKNVPYIKVTTFGHFNVTCDGEPVKFEKKKSKELFALLVDRRGAGVSREEIEATLWEDSCGEKRKNGTVQKVISSMMQSLEAAKLEELISRQYNSIAINPEKIDCDYYRFLQKDEKAIEAYYGFYMNDYPWAEYTNGILEQEKLKSRIIKLVEGLPSKLRDKLEGLSLF